MIQQICSVHCRKAIDLVQGNDHASIRGVSSQQLEHALSTSDRRMQRPDMIEETFENRGEREAITAVDIDRIETIALGTLVQDVMDAQRLPAARWAMDPGMQWTYLSGRPPKAGRELLQLCITMKRWEALAA